MKHLIGIFSMCALLWPCAPVWATLTGASAAPASVSAAYTQPAMLTLRWSVTASVTNNGPVLAQSTTLLITAPGGGVILGQISRRAQGTIQIGATTVIIETVQLPRSLMHTLYRARDPGGNPFPNFELHRDFSDGGIPVSAIQANLYLTGGGGSGQFDVSRLALYFDDRSSVRLIPREEPLQAVLDVQFSGSGQLAGVWEIADPTSTAGQPIYRPLRIERQSLVGAQSMQIKSPLLPTGKEGAYLLRFRLTGPTTDFDPVLIRYLVTSDTKHEKPPVNIQPEQPHNGALLGPKTTFAWRADQPASAYQLEIYRQPQRSAADQLPELGGRVDMATPRTDEPPVAGMLVLGDTHTTLLSKLVLQRLEPGRAYWWRVRAIGADGGVIGESPLRELRTP
jgi:hypothetical protein